MQEEKVPLTHGTLPPHIMRANIISLQQNSQQCQSATFRGKWMTKRMRYTCASQVPYQSCSTSGTWICKNGYKTSSSMYVPLKGTTWHSYSNVEWPTSNYTGFRMLEGEGD